MCRQYMVEIYIDINSNAKQIKIGNLDRTFIFNYSIWTNCLKFYLKAKQCRLSIGIVHLYLIIVFELIAWSFSLRITNQNHVYILCDYTFNSNWDLVLEIEYYDSCLYLGSRCKLLFVFAFLYCCVTNKNNTISQTLKLTRSSMIR